MSSLQNTNEFRQINLVESSESTSSRNNIAVARDRIRVVRIAHASLTPALRGRERALAKCYPNLDIEVITPPRWRETGVDVETVPDEFFPVRTARTFLSKHIQLFAYDPFPIIEAFRRHRPHIIDMDHEPYSVPCAEILTLKKWFAPNAKIVMQTAQNILKNYPPPFSIMERRALKRVSAAYMCSETVLEVLNAKGFDKPYKIAPFGVDLEMFKPKNIAKDRKVPFTIGFIGRLMPEKGLMTLADALNLIKDEKWRFVVVGDGEERTRLEERLSNFGLLERTEFVGAVGYEQTPEYFQMLDVLVIPTRTTEKIREQFGRVIVEAMACKIPVIGSTCGAIPEVVSDAGLIFEEEDSTSLAKQLRKVITNRDLREKLAIAGRERVEENYTWDRVAEKIYSLYENVLGLGV